MRTRAAQIAIILDVFGHPNQPYLTRWVRGLEELTDISVLPLAYETVERGRGISSLAPPESRPQKLWQFIEQAARSPQQALAVFRANGYGSIRQKANTWARYSPLFLNRPNAVHLVNAQRFDSLKHSLDLLGAPLIISFRGFDTLVRPLSDPEWRRTLREIYERAAVLHFVSDFIKQAAADLGAPLDKAKVIYRGVDTDFFDPQKVPVERPNMEALSLLSVGRLVWEKGHLYALRAVKLLCDLGVRVHYRIVGAGTEHKHLAFWCHELGIEPYVEFMGYRDHNAVRRLLRATDIYLHPSVSEGLPNSLFEASAMGVPIVASRIGGIPEIVEDGVTGLLVDRANPDAIADAVLCLARNEAKRAELGVRGRQKILRYFSSQTEIENWHKLYLEVLQKQQVNAKGM